MSRKPTKYVFVTGGVVSSIGKGLACASVGTLLEARGLRITHVKLDPYINVDPGTMSPYQHGEVFVTDDGAETDLDLGHYERFTSARMTPPAQLHDGAHLRGRHLEGAAGRVPGRDGAGHPAHHRRDQGAGVRDADEGVDVAIIEIGGTVGRHRVAPFPRGRSTDEDRGRPAERSQHPRHARAVHRHGRGAQDQADAALRQRDARDRHSARRAHLPNANAALAHGQREDLALLERRGRRGHQRPRRGLHLRGSAPLSCRGPRRARGRALEHLEPGARSRVVAAGR